MHKFLRLKLTNTRIHSGVTARFEHQSNELNHGANTEDSSYRRAIPDSDKITGTGTEKPTREGAEKSAIAHRTRKKRRRVRNRGSALTGRLQAADNGQGRGCRKEA
jgi:hypothetical protein